MMKPLEYIWMIGFLVIIDGVVGRLSDGQLARTIQEQLGKQESDPELVQELKGVAGPIRFGSSQQIDGGNLAVSSFSYDGFIGAVDIFERNGTTGLYDRVFNVQKQGRFFGNDVAIDGGFLAVGYHGAAGVHPDEGQVILYRKVAGTWDPTPFQIIKAVNPQEGDMFGASVSLSGSTLAIGCHVMNRVFLYEFTTDEVWELTQIIESSHTQKDQYFGTAVTLKNDNLFFGAAFSNITGYATAGAAYIFSKNRRNGLYEESKVLVSSAPRHNIQFGHYLAVSNDGKTLIVSSRTDKRYPNNLSHGSITVFQKNLGGLDNWGEEQVIIPPEPQQSQEFGFQADVNAHHIIIGAWGENDGNGAAYLFQRINSKENPWEQTFKWLAPFDPPYGRFGLSVGFLHGRLLSIAAPQRRTMWIYKY